MGELGQKNILITGASSGIGNAIALASAQQTSARLFVCGRNQNRLGALISRINLANSGSSCIPISGDLMDSLSHGKIINEIKESGALLDCLVFSAGIDKVMPFRMATQKTVEDMVKINMVIPLELCRLLLKANLINSGASIVFISSVMGLLGQQGQVAYCASKGGLISAAKALALELSSQQVRVNVIAPGIVKTELTDILFGSMSPESVTKIEQMHPLGLGYPQDIADLVLFLFSDKSKWITGSTITIDGGYSAH